MGSRELPASRPLTGSHSAYFSGPDVLPGEEGLHERLQRELIDVLADSHRNWGLVVQIEAKVGEAGSWGMLRSIQAGPGRYSCELIEISPADGSCLDNRFFTLVPPEERPSRASVVVLAKVAALVDSPDVRPLEDGQFDKLARQSLIT
jgi:hypothetical protein